MDAIHLWLSKLSMIFGILSIVLLSYDDFHKNIRKFISRWRYYFAGSIFVTINLFVYLVLTYAVIQQSPARLIHDRINVDGNFIDILMPLILAFVYFGAGAGSFRLGNKEIQLNKKLRETLEGLFNSKPLDLADVHYPEKETKQLYTQLREKAEKVNVVAAEKKWERILAKWHEFKEDEVVLKEQMTYLNKINEDLNQICLDLNSESPTAHKLTDVKKNIQDRVRNILKCLIKKVQKLLVAYAFKYYHDEAELEKYLVGIEVLDITKSPPQHIPNVINRGLLLGFMFGLLFGPLFGYLENKDVIFYCWRGALSLMLFTGCVSYGVHSGSWKKSVLVAGIGGYIAHFFWRLIDKTNLNALMQQSFDWLKDPLVLTEPIVGLSYGITTALILYELKYILGNKISNKYALYAIATLSGAISYPILNFLISRQDITGTTVILTASIGAIAMSSLSLAVNINNRVEKPASTPHPDENYLLYCTDCHHSQESTT